MKWELEDGTIISYVQDLSKLGWVAGWVAYAPEQELGKKSDFTILFTDGTTQVAKLIEQTIEEWWEDHKVPNFSLLGFTANYYRLEYCSITIAYIPKKWPTSRQITALKALIEIYKD